MQNLPRPKKLRRLPSARDAILWSLGVFTLLVFGCSENPLSNEPSADLEPAFVAIPSSEPRGSLEPQGVGDPRVTKRISAAKGGSIAIGRHIVKFAPRALLKDTDITLVDVTASAGRVQCELYPEGLVFLAPVTLQSNFSDLDNPAGYSMYWLNVPLLKWLNIGGKVSPDGKGIIVTLRHFSTYRPGKTGW